MSKAWELTETENPKGQQLIEERLMWKNKYICYKSKSHVKYNKWINKISRTELQSIRLIKKINKGI